MIEARLPFDPGVVGFGAEQLGGHAWGEIDIERCVAAVHRAVDGGVRLFDTADCYGLGLSEERLGQIFAGRWGDVVLSTKCGVRFDAGGKVRYDNDPAYIHEACRASLRRLGTGHIDLFQLHHRDPTVPLDDALGAFVELRDQGLIRAFGVSNVTAEELASSRVVGLSSASWEFSLAVRRHEGAIRDLVGRGLLFLGFGTLGQGILGGRHRGRGALDAHDRRQRSNLPNFHDRLDHNLRIVDTLAEVAAARPGRSPASVAIRWVMETIPGAIPLVGIKNPDQCGALLAAMADQLGPDERAALDRSSAPAGAP